MGFLDRINTSKTAEVAAPKTGAGKPNPLARKNPLAARKPSIPLKPKTEEIVKTEEEAVETTTETVEAVETTITAEVAEIAEAVEVAETIEEAEIDEEPAKADTEKQEETEPEASEEVAEEAQEEPEIVEVKQEEKQKPKKNNRRRTQKKEEASTESDESPLSFYEIPTTEVDYAEAVEAIRSPFKDETWEAFKEEIRNDLASIEVSDDLNPGTLKVIISELSILRDKIWFPLQEAKTEFERYSSKEPEGLIERVKRINASGGNTEERRRSGILACMNFETSAGLVNLYELMDESRERYTFLKSVDESIKFKKDILITMNGALKLDKDLM